MCLLFLLSELREKLDFSLSVVHVDHGIRGEAAREDAAFVEKWCMERGIPCRVVREDVPGIAKEAGLTLEEAGRMVRYRAFEEENPDKIAVAHHAEDSAETLLFQLFRGSGIRGLGGIRPVRGKIIRPLLEFTRQEIEDCLAEAGIPFRTDATNLDHTPARNRIRHEILPAAKAVNSLAVQHMLLSAKLLREAEEYLKEQAAAAAERFLSEAPDGSLRLSCNLFDSEPEILSSYVIKDCIGRCAGSEKDIGEIHVNSVRALGEKQSGKRVSLPEGVTAEREFGEIVFRPGSVRDRETGEKNLTEEIPVPDREPAVLTEEIPVPETGTVVLPDGERYSFTLSRKDESEIKSLLPLPELPYTKWFDYDKMNDTVVFRHRRPGDYLSIKGGRKKLKTLLLEHRIPAGKRDSLYVLAEGSHVLWVPGIRISEAYKITEDTRSVWKVERTSKE